MTELVRADPEENTLARIDTSAHRAGVMALAMMPQDEFEQRLAQLQAGQERLQAIHRKLMTAEIDYGVVPGTRKPTLLKPGAEKLCQFYGLREEFRPQVQYGDGETAPHITAISECRLHLGTVDGPVVNVGHGACSSWETKYRYRRGERACPSCGTVGTVAKSKEEWGGGWYCNAKRGGCGTKFERNDARITEQIVGNVENPDPFELLNTIVKMANKRSYVDATLRATATSGLYTQDVEDIPRPERGGDPAPDAAPAGNGQQRTGKAVQNGESRQSYAGASGAQPKRCSWHGCQAELKPAQATASQQNFGRALCPPHQGAVRRGEEEHGMQAPAGASVPAPQTPEAPAAAPGRTKSAREIANGRMFAAYEKACEAEGIASDDEMMRRHCAAALLHVLGYEVEVKSRADLSVEQLNACAEFFETFGIPSDPADPFQDE